jgi:choline kinase
VILAIDNVKRLGHEEMKVCLGPAGLLTHISKHLASARADGEYIGATLIEPAAAGPLASALADTWRRDPSRYYEDGYAELARRGEPVAAAPIGAAGWVEVDDHADLDRARQIAPHCW